MRIVLSLGLLALGSLNSCLNGHIEQGMHDGLQPYFPKAHVQLVPDKHAIVAITCAANLGDQFPTKAGELLAQDPQIRQLKMLQGVRGASYTGIGLGFEKSVLLYNISTGQYYTQPMNDSYAAEYRRDCGLEQPPQLQADATGNAYVWIGYWKVLLSYPDGRTYDEHVAQTLGLYDDEQTFERHKQRQLELVEQQLKESWVDRNITPNNLRFDHVEKVLVTVH